MAESPRRRRSPLWYWAIAGAFVVLIAGFLAFAQAPYPDPYRLPRWPSWSWFAHPMEWNAPLRLDRIEADLHSVAVRESGSTTETWVVGDGLFLARSADGETWTKVALPKPETSIQFNSSGTLYITAPTALVSQGGDKAPAQAPHGAKSNPAAPPPHRRVLAPRNLYDVTFVDEKGWVVGDAGAIAHTVDGGKTWAWQSSPVEVILDAVRFQKDGLTGVAVGAAGVILSTRDGGATWSRLNPPPIPWPDVLPRPAPTAPYAPDAPPAAPVPAPAVPAKGFDNVPVHEDDDKGGTSRDDPPKGRETPSKVVAEPKGAQQVATPSIEPLPNLDPGLIHWQGLAPRGDGFVAVGMYVARDWDPVTHELGISNLPPRAPIAPVLLGFVAVIDPDPTSRGPSVAPGPLALDIPDALLAVDFRDARVGLACGISSFVATDDGGKGWSRLTFSKKARLSVGVALTGARSGFVVDLGRRTLLARKDDTFLGWSPYLNVSSSEDGGRSWTSKGELIEWAGWSSGIKDQPQVDAAAFLDLMALGAPRIAAIAFDKGGSNGWVVGPCGFINRTKDAGKTWVPVTRFLPRATGAWVNDSFEFVSNPANPPVASYPTPAPVLVLYDYGFRGYPYFGSPFHPGRDQPARLGFDRWSRPGLSYRRLPAPWFWLVLATYPALLVVGLVQSRRRDPTVDRSEISPTLRSDRPLEPGDPDALGFDRIARGLSRFLRNENTEPPLTIAITGEWGSGKSSLMSLVQADLKGRGFRPVWFNAWHHQQEEQQLASLLATIRNEALPTLSRPLDWLWFSSRLVWRRGRKYAGLLIPTTLVFAVSLGFLLQDRDRIGEVFDQVRSLGDSFQKKAEPEKAKDQDASSKERAEQARSLVDQLKSIEEIQRLLDEPGRPDGANMSSIDRDRLREKRATLIARLDEETTQRPRPPRQPSYAPPGESAVGGGEAPDDGAGLKHPAVLALFLSGIGLAVSLWRGLTAFGLKPGTLLASMSKSVGVRDLSAQAGFRYQFGREFADVTWALRPRTLVLLVDDLDRCHPDRVMQVLEMVNYLVSSGECVVVMGMAKARVIRCIAKVFKDVAEGDPDASKDREAAKADDGKASGAASGSPRAGDPEGPDGVPAPPAGEGLKEYARNYLEKIINIEVPVPQPSEEQARLLLLSDGDASAGASSPAAPDRRSRLTRALAGVPALAPRLATTSIVLVAVILGLWLGGFLAGPRPTADGGSAGGESAPADLNPVSERKPPTEPVPAPAPPMAPVAPSATSSPHDPSSPPPDLVGRAATTPLPPSKLSSGDRARWMTAAASVIGLMALGIVFAALSWLRAPVVVVKDSPEFVKALDIWYPVIAARPYTPRTLKRFLNRVRFVAARMGDPKPERSRWDELLERIDARLARRPADTPPTPAATGSGEDAPPPRPEKPEAVEEVGPAPADTPTSRGPSKARDAMVVAFCSLARFDADWLKEDDAWSRLGPEDLDAMAVGPDGRPLDADEVRLLREALARHRAEFPESWPPSSEQRSRFLEVEQPS